ncbi:MAG: Asp-tRNA(Asn)/Glu-tRNA(Gln) amidotransferase subunit GatB [Clostridiales bacterium]|jgi:aspartyl-tRNA(Asn)/glutamyl-tRNA(Gln) amidotransferase subunit B|nr:Asp-tRNA(Asn)/Glu-tRNA(Gln) amidotransferase subunit GatB [Clostridiales bacterium]
MGEIGEMGEIGGIDGMGRMDELGKMGGMGGSMAGGYETVIGLEIHAELLTRTKVFCGCPNAFGSGENTNVCPTCLGLPGALPVLSRAAVECAVKAGLALGCSIARRTRWDRKNYFYADSPKAYQISQLYAPLCIGGGLEAGGRFVRINHIHLEEDAGKLVHDGARRATRMDFNRCGVPLIEIVTEPDMRSAAEAAEFIERVREALVYAGVCDGKMEQGSLRVDANISVRPAGSDRLGTRAEIKNLNSFRHVAQAIEHEAGRQIELIEAGGAVVQETRRFLEGSGETAPLRSKEDAHDYRYFPDPDILPLEIGEAEVEALRAQMGEPPEARKARYVGEFGMSPADAGTILARKFVSDFYDDAVACGADPREAGNMVRGEVLRFVGESGAERVGMAPGELARLLRLAASGEISANSAKKAAAIMLAEGKGADAVIAEHGMRVSEDLEKIRAAAREALAARPDAVQAYRGGEAKILGYFIGQCNRALRGSARPQAIEAVLRGYLDGGEGGAG